MTCMINIHTYINTNISTVMNNSDNMFNQSCSINYSGKAMNTFWMLTRVFLTILLNGSLFSLTMEINIIGNSLTTIGNSESIVSKILWAITTLRHIAVTATLFTLPLSGRRWNKNRQEMTVKVLWTYLSLTIIGYKIRKLILQLPFKPWLNGKSLGPEESTNSFERETAT